MTTATGTIETFESILELLPEDADLTLEDLDRCVRQLPRLTAMREEARNAAASVTALVDVDGSPELLDWSDYSAYAQSLSDFLSVCGSEPLEPLAMLTSDSELKQSLEQALTRLDEILTGDFQCHWKTLGQLFPLSSSVSTGVILDQLDLSALQDWVTARLTDLPRLSEWLTFRETEQALSELGVATVLSEILQGKIEVEEAAPAFLRRLYRVWLDAVYQSDPVLRSFQVAEHERLLEEFRQLDRQSVEGASDRIRGQLLNSKDRPRANQLNAPPSSELGILTREVEKKRRHLPLRLLFKQVPTLIQRLKPCFMMSPLAVSTFLDEAGYRFDVVIFDEASQVHPHDAIGAVYRGQQLIVAGDQKQLPPSSFFERMVNDDASSDSENDSEDPTETTSSLRDYESLLDVCCSIGLPRQRLRWHYRSRREPLIAFSNRHFYDNELVTFPSVLDATETSAVTLHYVPDGRWQSGKSGGFNAAEARATVELIRQHMMEHPNQSLGVITLNQRQQLAVLDELEELKRREPELISLFSQDREEPFFVKNLENVQGDERDRIILSIGYGFDQTGKFAMRFGPLNNQGGERRLNVAVTRAKHQVTVVSSIHAHDIDLSRTSAVGVRLLRAYLEFAERGLAALGAEITEANSREADSEFEESVEAALIARGFHVHRQVGCSGYRIDLALTHPTQTGRYVLGVECDGASYHSSATARDRDRLRQSVLEQLGWKLIRVWSTDWIRDPQRQVARIEAAFDTALRSFQESGPTLTKPIASQYLERGNAMDEQPIGKTPSNNSAPIVRMSALPCFDNIDNVPQSTLRNIVIGLLRRFGQTPRQELISAVARELGFQRTGSRIQERIEAELHCLKEEGCVNEDSIGYRVST
jgi:very-short-patch-repair endonuclease